MNINSNRFSPNFKAQYLFPAKVQKLNPTNNEWVKVDTCIAELHPKDIKDLNVLADLNVMWRANINEMCFASDLYQDALNVHTNAWQESEAKRNFWALTTQKENFERLVPEEILGISEITADCNNGPYEIAYLQVAPEHKRNSHFREFKYVGSAIMNKILEFFKGNIVLTADSSAVDFYKIFGFVEKDVSSKYQLILKRK